MRCVVIGLPAWYIMGYWLPLMISLEKAGHWRNWPGPLFQYMAIAFWRFKCVGLLSQWFAKPEKSIVYFLRHYHHILQRLSTFCSKAVSSSTFYWICAGLGYGTGFSVVYITMSAEQFGTNPRARCRHHSQYGSWCVTIWTLFKTVQKLCRKLFNRRMDYRNHINSIYLSQPITQGNIQEETSILRVANELKEKSRQRQISIIQFLFCFLIVRFVWYRSRGFSCGPVGRNWI